MANITKQASTRFSIVKRSKGQSAVEKGDVLVYQIRQSFKPGEITPEEANEVGYETGMRFTKGKHAFIVATHVDRAHIHNHIIFNSTNLNCDRKFRDFWFSGIALQRLSDIICLEHGLSIIPKVKPSERQRRTKYPERTSMRDTSVAYLTGETKININMGTMKILELLSQINNQDIRNAAVNQVKVLLELNEKIKV